MMRWGVPLLLLALVGCASAARVQVRPEAEAFRPRVVAVYPYELRFEAPPWHRFQQARTLTDAVAETGRFLVIGPRELKIFRPEMDRPLVASSVGTVLSDLGLGPDHAIVLRGWAEQRLQTASKTTFDSKGRAVGHLRSEARTYILHLQALSVHPGQVLVEGTLRVQVDPFAIQPEWDPLAPLTRASRELAQRVLSALEAPATSAVELGALVQVNPAQAFVVPGLEGPSASLATLDLLEREVLELSVYRFFDRELPSQRLRLYRKQHEGTVVQEVRGGAAAASGLLPGDLVTRCGDWPVLGPEVLHRCLALGGEEGVSLQVLREGAPVRLLLRHP